MTSKAQILTWAQEQRINWIVEMINIYGFVNRDHVMRKFRVSTPQASADFSKVLAAFPGLMTYDPSAKQYKGRCDG